MKNIIAFLFLFSSLFASSQTQYIGAPNTTVVARGNMKVDSILYLPKREKTPTDTGALRYQISDSSLYVWTGNAWRKAKNDGTVTSVGLTMPSAFAVANSPVTGAGTLAVTATGTVAEYIRGDGSLGTLPSSGGGGGSGVNYYLNGSVSQGTIGGSTYYEMNKTPVIGAGTDFSRGTDGIVAQFITDSLDPNRLLIPAGAWNFELYFSASSAGGTPSFYIELFEYDGTNFTSIASSVSNPISITNGTAVSLYVASLAVPETVLTATDRLAVRISVNVSGRTITLHTEDNNLAQVITTFSGGLVSLNGLTANDQFFTTGTSGSDFNISSTSATHTFNLPTASSTVRGALSSANWTTFNNKVNISDTAAMLTNYIRHGGYGLTKTGQALSVDTAAIATRAWRQKGIDSVASVRVGGTGTTNYIPKWSGTSTQTISTIFDNGNVGIGTTSPGFTLDIAAAAANQRLIATTGTNRVYTQYFNTGGGFNIGLDNSAGTGLFSSGAYAAGMMYFANYPLVLGTNSLTRQIIHANGRVGINTTTDAGYQLDIAGSLRNTTGANFATSSGNVGIKNTNPAFPLDINTTTSRVQFRDGASTGGTSNGSGLVSLVSDLTGLAAMNNRASLHTFIVGSNEVVRINGAEQLLVGTTEDDGYKLNLYGNFRSTTGANFATSSGNVGIGNTSPSEKLHVTGRIRATTIDSTATAINMLYADANGVIKKAAVPSGGGGSVTSITAGTGLTGGTITTSGTIAVDTASIATRARVQKGIDSVASLTTAKVGGTGISGYFPKWTGASSQDTSQLFQLGRNIGIGTATPTYRIHLPDAGNVTGQAMIAGTVLGSDGNGQTIRPSGSVAMALFGQNDIGYIYGAAVSSTGRWGINTRSLNDATLSIDGSVKIVTIDSTSTARNMLYADANGVIKKSAVPTGGITGSGTASYLPKWTSGSAIGNSVAYDNGGELLISTTEDAGDFKLQVAGAIYTTSTISTGGVNGETSKTWKLGSRRAATVSLDATQYLEVEVNGVLYYIAMITIN